MEETNKQQTVINEEDLLEFKVGPLRFCAPVFQVEAIISPPKIIHVPLSENVVAGCFDHQGRTATVLSMHNKFGLPFTLKENESHIILATVDNELKGFWVDQAIDIIQLAAYESKADYAANERKAYSNFLTSDEKIILQTSFPRLHKCDSSDLNWIAGPGANNEKTIDEDDATDISSNDFSNKNETSDNVSAQEAASTQQSEAMDAGSDTYKSDNNLEVRTSNPVSVESTTTDSVGKDSNVAKTETKAFSSSAPLQTSAYTDDATSISKTGEASTRNANPSGRLSNVFESEHEARKKQSTAFDSRATNSAYTGDRNVAKTSSQAYSSSMPSQTRTYDSIASSESKAENKNTGLFIMAAALLLLLALTLLSVYLIDASTESTIHRSKKTVSYRDKYETRVAETPAPTIVVDNFIEPEPVKIAPSENQSLNEVAEKDESMPEPSANARIFELHVNEQLDSEQYAITSFEPVEHQRETAPDTQQFTHIVVKGDTLWHITRRYLDNPHRYPELAAASHINNPHRIYPGDVIKIIVNRAKNKN